MRQSKHHGGWRWPGAGEAICLWTLSLAFLVFPGVACAERYLTVEEALRVCFPDANGLEARTLKLDRAQAKEFAAKTKVRIKDGTFQYWVAKKKGEVLGVAIFDQAVGKHDWIDYMVAIQPDGQVRQVEILEFRERYGAEVRSPKWRAQFQGKTGSAAFQINEDIYNISGATLSCRNVANGVKRDLVLFEDYLRPHLPAPAAPDPDRVSPPN